MGAAVYPQLARLGPAVRDGPAARSDTRRALDAVRLAVGSTAVLAALSIGSIAVGIGLAAVGLWLAIGALRHLLPAGALRLAPGRPAVVATTFGVSFAFFGTEAFVPLSVVEVRGGSVTLGGVALSAAAVTWAGASWLQARAASAGIRRALVTSGAGLIGVGIVITAAVLLPDVPVLVAALGWTVAGLGMGLAYSMLALVMLETAAPGEEGFSSSAFQLMFTLGTAFGAGIGGAIVAMGEGGALELAPGIGIVFGLMLVVALLTAAVSLRVPRGPAGGGAGAPRPVTSGVPLEHP
jgi:hypothetical protein